MPSITFYAAGTDLHRILNYVFDRSGCRVFENYSPFGEGIAEFKSVDELSARYSLGECQGGAPGALLALVTKGASDLFEIQRIALRPEFCEGHTFRYTIAGWGLIHLHLGGTGPHGLVSSNSNHFTAAGARQWVHTHSTLEPVEAWNWAEVASVSSALNRFIRKLAVFKIASRPVLPIDAAQFSQGLRPAIRQDAAFLEAHLRQLPGGIQDRKSAH
jgi:hypothetical protein